MEITKQQTDDTIELTVDGGIISIDHTERVKGALSDIFSKTPDIKVHILFQNSETIPSALLGYLLKIKRLEKRSITLYPSKTELFQIFENLSLTQILDVQRPG